MWPFKKRRGLNSHSQSSNSRRNRNGNQSATPSRDFPQSVNDVASVSIASLSTSNSSQFSSPIATQKRVGGGSGSLYSRGDPSRPPMGNR